VYTPQKTASYENLVRLAFLEQNKGAEPEKGPVQIEMTFYFAPPKSAYWPVNSKHNGELKVGWWLRKHTSKPDRETLGKAVLDGLNGVAFVDDSQIWRVTASKMYHGKPYVAVTLIGDGDGDTRE
jgi:Holliday junction resolvase RusA-like endonuclease